MARQRREEKSLPFWHVWGCGKPKWAVNSRESYAAIGRALVEGFDATRQGCWAIEVQSTELGIETWAEGDPAVEGWDAADAGCLCTVAERVGAA